MGCAGLGLGAIGAGVHTQLSGAAAMQLSASCVSAATKFALQSVPAGVSGPLEHLPTWSVMFLS